MDVKYLSKRLPCLFSPLRMKRPLVILALMLGGINASQAQLNDTFELGEVLVQDNRFPVKFSESMRNITIITSKEIAAMPSTSVQEVLSYVTSLDVRQRGAGGGQADISLRGGSFDQCLILIDGVKFSDPQTGHHMMNIPILPQDIERIEILRGSASRIFGQNGFSGAVNIVTKKEYQKSINAEISTGQYASGNAQISISNENKKGWGNRLSLGYSSSAGYQENRDFTNLQGLYQSRYQLSNHSQIRLLAGIQQKAFGAQYFYTPPVAKYKEYEETLAAFGTLSGQFTKLANLTINLNWRRHQDEFRLWRDSTERGVNKHVSYVYSFDANIYEKWKYGISSLGIDIRNEQILSSALDTHDRSIAAVFLEHQFPKQKTLNAVIGTNISYITGYGWVAYPGAEVGIRINSMLKTNLSIGRSYRVPTFTDLYYTDGGPTSLGNAKLKPEEAWTYEAGLVFQLGNFFLQSSYFLRDASTLIDWQKENPNDKTWLAMNIIGTQTNGIEAQATYKFKTPLIKQAKLAYTYLTSSRIETVNTSRYVYDYLKNQIVASIELAYTSHIGQSIYYRYMERIGYPTAHVVDTRLRYHHTNWSAWLQWENITQTQYFQVRNVPMPQTWVRVGLSVSL